MSGQKASLVDIDLQDYKSRDSQVQVLQNDGCYSDQLDQFIRFITNKHIPATSSFISKSLFNYTSSKRKNKISIAVLCLQQL